MTIWFKHDAHAEDHPKFIRLRRLAGNKADAAEVGWWRLVAAAKRMNEWSFEDEEHLRHVIKRYYGFVELYRAVGLLDGLVIHNGDEYQASQDPKARTRMGVYRAKRAGAGAIEAVEYNEVFARAEGICGVCHKPVDKDGTIDHIKPLSKGGEHTYDNVTLAHRSCNARKSTLYPYEPVTGAVTPAVTATVTSESREEQREQSRTEQTEARDDIVDDYYRLTGRFPTDTVREWVDRLANEFGYAPTSKELGRQYAADPNTRTLLGRVENELKAGRHIATKRQAEAEKARLEAEARAKDISPAKAAENQRALKALMADWFSKDAA